MIAKTYSPSEIEEKWYKYWIEHKLFESRPDHRKPFTIVIPPPNVTGVLHMGHMLNNTIQDILIRKARMQGKNACWVPGTDHASIATEAKVVKMLKDEMGIEKSQLTREQFLEYAWQWKEKYGGIILKQLEKLGASCDWSRTRFTMEPELNKAVIKVFVDLYRKGHIYRGARMVNWDPQGKTALSDEEVVYKEAQSKLVYVRYRIAQTQDEWITIATVRPETILGDTAIAVNPDDPRYQHLIGKKAIVPLAGREIPIIADSYVEIEFGTGCLKVTPAHDMNDYEIGLRHNLPIIDTITDEGKMSEAAGYFIGEDRFVARKKMMAWLEENGHIVKIEEITNKIGYSERTSAVIEPKITTQWFVKMKEICKPALESVLNGTIRLHPNKFINIYRHWMENVRDWCISRQLWWGQRIPAYYLPDGSFVVAESFQEALELAQKNHPGITANDLRQDEDVLDTWFSSWLWPISVFDGLTRPDNEDIKYYYPTNVLVTAPEILFFWVARMIIAGYEWMGKPPFTDVYLTGIVRDKQGRKMSKSLGNSPEPLDLIAKYGADGVRYGMLCASPAGNDLLFDEKLCEQGRNFCNKIWNAFRLVEGWDTHESPMPTANALAIAWFEARMAEKALEMQAYYDKFRISDALSSIYSLIWDDFCAWYLEIIKPEYQKPIDSYTKAITLRFFDVLLRLLHPFMPFITEEIWQHLAERKSGQSICIAQYPGLVMPEKHILAEMDFAFQIIAELRNIRAAKQLSPKAPLVLHLKTKNRGYYHQFGELLQKMGFLEKIEFVDKNTEGAIGFVIKADEFFVPLAGLIDTEKERENMLKELEYMRGFLASVEQKLSNERFLAHASAAVVEKERQKKADAEAKIRALEQQLGVLAEQMSK